MNNQGLDSLGYDEWFGNASSDLIPNGFTSARVIEVNKGNYRVSDGKYDMLAELSGKVMYATENSTDLPTAGDWVVIQALDGNSLAIIHNVLPRKTLLKRKEPGRKIDFQLIASNIDYGLVVQSADSLNLNSLERYLVMLNESKINPILVFTKIDLLSSSQISELRTQVEKFSNTYVFISNISEGGIETLSNELVPKQTYCLLGPSGAGKTSLLNRLLGKNLLKVKDVRDKDGKGRHTTVRRQLVRLESGSIFIDTPGLRELGNFNIASGIEQTFETISLYAKNCRFRDCTHIHEERCAVLKAVEKGEIDSERYQNYLKLNKEANFYEMSYTEKRNKDKSFGKMVKNYKKAKRRND
ncbi:ribosome small subunit-dependent GTPase A [Fibrobacterota bacterium]